MPEYLAKPLAQTERLRTVRPRSAYLPDQRGGSGNRGARSRLKLLSSDPGKSRSNSREGFSSAKQKDEILSKLLDNGEGQGYIEFLLTGVNVQFNEKVQITQTFGDSETVYYFGKAPVFFNLSGVLIDSIDNPWFTKFVEMYSHVIRGTELARNYELVELTLPNMAIVGSITSFTYNQTAERDTDIPFGLQMHAKKVTPIPTNLAAAPLACGASLVDLVKAENFTQFQDTSGINSYKTKLDQANELVKNPFSTITDARKVFGQVGTLGDNIMINAASINSNAPYTQFEQVLGQIGSTGGPVGRAVSGSLVENTPFDQAKNTFSGFGAKVDLTNTSELARERYANATTPYIEGADIQPANFIGQYYYDQPSSSAVSSPLSSATVPVPQGVPLSDGNTALPQGLEATANGSIGCMQFSSDIQNPLGNPGDRTLSAGVAYVKKAGASLANGKMYIPGVSPAIFGDGGGFGDVTSSITAFRASLFSPVFGILTTITKVVQTITSTIAGVISKFTEPINAVLRDIRAVSNQAAALVSTIQGSVKQIVDIPLKTLNDARRTLITLKNTAGIISQMPETLGSIVKRLTKGGFFKTGAPFLSSGGKKPKAKVPILNSGRPYTAALGAIVRG